MAQSLEVKTSPRKTNNFRSMSLEDLIESKNFILNIDERLRDSFPVGNIYANKINYFRNLGSIDRNSPLNQLLITS